MMLSHMAAWLGRNWVWLLPLVLAFVVWLATRRRLKSFDIGTRLAYRAPAPSPAHAEGEAPPLDRLYKAVAPPIDTADMTADGHEPVQQPEEPAEDAEPAAEAEPMLEAEAAEDWEGAHAEAASQAYEAEADAVEAEAASGLARSRPDRGSAFVVGHEDASDVVLGSAPPREEEFDLVEIFFGTDRAPSDEPGRYGGKRGHGLHLGVATVSAPRDRPPGSVTRPRKLFMFTIEKEDPARHFVVQDSVELDQAAFRAQLGGAAAEAGDHPALLFVHGFNSSFDGALYRAAQLAIDLSVSGPMLMYSWPSKGGMLGYDTDRENVKQARVHFAAFLDQVFASGVKRLNILAHSMGNDLLLETLEDRPRTRLRGLQQVVLAAPDVDSDVAANLVPRVSPKAKGMTLYACSEDLAIGASKAKAGGAPRAGGLLADGYPLIVAGLDSIDASSCKLRLAEFNHNGFVADTVLRYDLAALLASGRRPPHQRSPSITQASCPRGGYWLLQAR
jgi:esterase/lipase superfamily enzyme